MHTCISSHGLKRSWRSWRQCRQQKHTQHAPSTKTECDYLNGWIKKRSHTQKSHPKAVNPRDIAGERKEKKKKKVVRNYVLFSSFVDSVGPQKGAVGRKSFGKLAMVVEVLVISAVGEASVFYCILQAVFRATGRPSSCSFEGRYAPRSPDPRTNDENTGPHNSESAQYEGRSNAESTNLQHNGVEGRTAPPLEPRVNTEIRRPTRAMKLEPELTTGCESTHESRSVSETPPDCSGETCSLSEETKAPQRQQLVPPATRHDTAKVS